MATGLVNNLTSSYFTAAQKLYSKSVRKRIVAYVESYDDIAFWKMLLKEFEDEHHYFQVMLPSANSLTKGKKMALLNALNVEALGQNMIVCVDSDYDFLLQGTTPVSKVLNSNKYIFQTYVYAIENYQCWAHSLHDVCVQATLNDHKVFNFEGFMKEYSEIIYPLFIWNIYFYKKHDTHTFPMYKLHELTAVHQFSFHHPQKSLTRIREEVNKMLKHFQSQYANEIDDMNSLAKELEYLGLYPETTYLYMQGHHIMNDVVLKLLNPVCNHLRREREKEIERLAQHEEQYHNELTAYRNSLVEVKTLLRRSLAYKESIYFNKIRSDLEVVIK